MSKLPCYLQDVGVRSENLHLRPSKAFSEVSQYLRSARGMRGALLLAGKCLQGLPRVGGCFAFQLTWEVTQVEFKVLVSGGVKYSSFLVFSISLTLFYFIFCVYVSGNITLVVTMWGTFCSQLPFLAAYLV